MTHSSNLVKVFRNTISGMQQKQAKADGWIRLECM